ncbi:MAG: hypothetical protein H6559_37805 [Lewinellaceae bacterium]|nr:hypothetical protein [Lewinellaceae bacterium]
MSKKQKSTENGNSPAEQVRNFTIEAAAILTAGAPALLLIVILVSAVAASYIEYAFHKEVVGQFAMVSGSSYGMFRFAVGGAGVQMAKIQKWIPAGLFIAISLAFTAWSTYHVDTAARELMVGGTVEAARIILLTILWTAFAGELALGIFSYSMDLFRANQGNEQEGEEEEEEEEAEAEEPEPKRRRKK